MSYRRLNIPSPWRGFSSVADFKQREGYVRDALNIRFMAGEGATNRYGSELVRNLSEVSIGSDLKYERLDSDLVVFESGSPSSVKVFGGDGVELTVYRQATLDFTSGGTVEVEIGDEITGSTSGATGVVTGVRLDGGTWSGGDASGVLTIRWTSPSTGFDGSGENIDIGASSDVATIAAWGTSSDTALNGPVPFTYLGSDLSKIRTHSIEDSVFVLNVDQEVGTRQARGTLSSVVGEVSNYIDKLASRQGVTSGDIWRTVISDPGYPAGYYQAYQSSQSGTEKSGAEPPPLWRRIPKPAQEDALYDASTMPHRLLRIDDTTYEWQRLPWSPRLSGGDEQGENEYGEKIVLNDAVLKGRKIVAMTFWNGRFAFALDDKSIALSEVRAFFNFFLDDVNTSSPADPIFDQLIAQNSGEVRWIEAAGPALWIQCDHLQAQFGSRDQILSAGSAEEPYNGRIDIVGEFESGSLQPRAWTTVIFMVDANGYIRPFINRGSDTDYRFTPMMALNEMQIRDMRQKTYSEIRVEDTGLYVICTDGSVYLSQLWGVQTSREGGMSVTSSWSRLEFDESIVFAWAYENRIRVVTEYGDGLSLVTMPWTEQSPPDDIAYLTRFDRSESIEGVYDEDYDETVFTPNTTPAFQRTRMELLSSISRVPFDSGSSTIAVGDTVTGATSGATGVVFRVRLDGSSSFTGSGYGSLFVRKTNDASFVDDEDIEVSSSVCAVVDGNEEDIGRRGKFVTPVGLRFSFNSGGTDVLTSGDTVTGGTSGATGRVLRVDLASGAWGDGDAAGNLLIEPASESDIFESGEDLSVDGTGNICTLTSGHTQIVFRSRWGPTSGDAGSVVVNHNVGRLFRSELTMPTLWPGMSSDRIWVSAVSVFHHDTSDYRVRVTRNQYEKSSQHVSKRMGLYRHGQSPIETGYHRSLVGSQGTNMVLSVVGDTSGQFEVSGMEIEYERSRF